MMQTIGPDPDPSWPLQKCSQDGAGPKLGLSRTNKGTEILHLVNDEHLIGWWHHWPTGAGPISPDPTWSLSKCSQDGSGPQPDKLGLSRTNQGHRNLTLVK